MGFAFCGLLMLNGVAGVFVWWAWQRVTAHMRECPEAADLIARHVIAPLLTGKRRPEEKDNNERIDS